MVKPQFEVGKDRVGKGGVVRDLALRAEAVTAVADGAPPGAAGVPVAVDDQPAARARRATSSSSCWLRRGRADHRTPTTSRAEVERAAVAGGAG